MQIVLESPEFLDVDVGITACVDMASGRILVESDVKVAGDIWRVHLTDADPYPSKPHAHCVGGSKRYLGKKLHLGSGQLFDSKNNPTTRRLEIKQFERLIKLIQPKFPNVKLPLPSA